MRPKALASTVGAVVLIGAASASGAGSRDPWAPLRRPLQLRPLAAGARCPVTPTRRLDHGRIAGVGSGPVYPMPPMLGADDGHPGWLESKTIWSWPERLVTHRLRVLVRGMRLDRPGAMRFQLGPQWDTAPLTAELHIDTTHVVGAFANSNWGTTVTMLLARKPGCYGLQLDSARGTSTIVFGASRT